MKHKNLKKLTTIALLCALSYMAVLLIRIPAVLFLKYEPKDVIITIGGLIYGPLTAFIITVVVSLIEMVTISTTGIIGFVMNVISSAAFACTSSFIYKKSRNKRGAYIGLACGTVVTVAVMMLWNYLLTPLYMEGTTREQITSMLLPVFFPFNLFKGIMNMGITLLLYKPVVTALRRAKIISSQSNDETEMKKMINPTTVVISLVLIASAVLIILFFK